MTIEAGSQAEIDGLYAELVELHRGLDAEAALRLTARLVLLLMQEVGDLERVRACLSAARRDGRPLAAPAQKVGIDIPAA